MNILALSCSPRRGGNTDLLTDELLRGFQDSCEPSRCIFEKLSPAKMNISPCTQCEHCHIAGLCKIQDDMQPLYDKLLRADWLILASPIYFMAHCAQAKLIIDRCQALWARRHILKQSLQQPGRPKRRAVFIAVGATHGPKVFAGAEVTMKWWLEALETEYWSRLLFEGLDAKAAVCNHPTALAQAYQLGQKMAQTE